MIRHHPETRWTFRVAKSSGIYLRDQVWKVSGVRARGADPVGAVDIVNGAGHPLTVTPHTIDTLVNEGVLELIDRNELAKAKQIADLRARSPMRSTKAQDDASGLALFQHFDEPRLL
jgi:hypothetical protein